MRLHMNIAQKIKALLKEAELYRSQGLLAEALVKYNKASELMLSNEQLKTKQNLVDGISKKVTVLEKEIEKLEKAPKTPEVSPHVQSLIKQLFSFSQEKDEDAISLDGAIALAKFGQYERALSEFSELIKKDALRVVAAKNILRCHMSVSSVDEAITQYEQWLSSDLFIPDQLKKIRVFFEGILDKEGIDKTLPQVETSAEDKEIKSETPGIESAQSQEPEIGGLEIEDFEFEDDEIEDDEVLDINSIKITIERGKKEGDTFPLNVNFQSGNVISLFIPSRDKDLIENFKVGDMLNNIEFYSPIAIFNGSGLISDIAKIKTGPRRGDYNLDIKIVDN